MKLKTRSKDYLQRRRGERGAALVTMLLVSTMLLAAGGALILATSLAGTNAADATTEVQAYYAAEAGMQASINVLRRNVPSNPAGTSATFRNAVSNPTLAPWLNYTNVGGTQRVVVSANPPASFTVTVTDPDSTPAAQEPTRLIVRVTGFGPRGSTKQTEMIVHRSPYDFDPPATISFIGAEAGQSMRHPAFGGSTNDFDIGESSPKGYSGTDQAGVKPARSSFGFTRSEDRDIANYVFANDPKALASTDDTPRAKLLANSDLPTWLRTANNARLFVNDMRMAAQGTLTPGSASQTRYFTTSPAKGNYGTDARPLITFVNGDCDFSGDGAGLLIVTGKLTITGGATFKGVVLMLGQGELERKGGGGGGIFGALVMANFSNTMGTNYLARPRVTTSGGGNSEIRYNSTEVARAFQTLAPSVRAVREF